MKPGDVVVVQGTGGAALFGVQFAKLVGASVIVLSSSDEKLRAVRELGADFGINYRTNPDWHLAVKEFTGGRGADLIIETGGSTLAKSLSALTFGGFIGVVGSWPATKRPFPFVNWSGRLLVSTASRRVPERASRR